MEIFPAQSNDTAVRVEFFGDEVDRISEFNPLTGEIKADLKHIAIYPASHYIVPKEKMKEAIQEIEQELEERLAYFRREGKLLEAQRIEQRTRYDIEMLQEIGFCKGIENLSLIHISIGQKGLFAGFRTGSGLSGVFRRQPLFRHWT